MRYPYHTSTPDSTGSLHSFDNERDNCGMGAIANINGVRSYEIVDLAIESVCNMTHRGAVDADMKTGDGSGILSQIPYPIFRKAAADLGTEVSNDEDLAVGVFFLPREDAQAIDTIKHLAVKTIGTRGIGFIGWREAPVAPEELGELAQKTRPLILHLLMEKPEGWDADHFERQLYLSRRSIEHETKEVENFYITSFSSRLISYKGLAMPATLKAFYLDLQNPEFETAICLVEWPDRLGSAAPEDALWLTLEMTETSGERLLSIQSKDGRWEKILMAICDD